MLRRRHINADQGGRVARFLLDVADAARWPFERLAWAVEERLVWPLRERTAGFGPAGHVAGAGALVAVAAVAVLVGALLSGGGGKSGKEVAAPARVAIAPPPVETAPEEPTGPALQGVPPSFGVGRGVGVAEGAGGAGSDGGESATEPAGGSVEEEAEAGAGEPGEGAATASQAKPVPAGPAAMKVARRFSEAFVFYEIGERPARAKTVFGETATPQLAEALAERPPRLPQDAKVPKAKVVNLVPGPRHGKAYTISASLLRVGLTSELRLEMKRQQDGEWLITDVRG
jgi:hypothetical protein